MRVTQAALVAPLALLSLASGCGSGRLSDGDIVRFCRLLSRCTGVTQESCEASARSGREQADEQGCARELNLAARCAIAADTCDVAPGCADENERLRMCQAGGGVDTGIPGVDAGMIPVTPSEVRLSDLGAIEILHEGTWLPICDDGFGMEEANVACRHLGYSGAAGYSTVTGPISDFWLDDVSCVGTERWLDECAHSGWGVHNCSATETQAVTCF